MVLGYNTLEDPTELMVILFKKLEFPEVNSSVSDFRQYALQFPALRFLVSVTHLLFFANWQVFATLSAKGRKMEGAVQLFSCLCLRNLTTSKTRHPIPPNWPQVVLWPEPEHLGGGTFQHLLESAGRQIPSPVPSYLAYLRIRQIETLG